MAKRRVGSQIINLTPDHKKLGIAQVSLRVGACNILLESPQRGLQLCFRPDLNRRSAHKVMRPQSWDSKVVGVPTLGILGLPLGSPMKKWHLGAGLMAMHTLYYKGEGDGFPQVQAVVNLVSLCLLVVRSCIKVLQLCTNQLVIWFVQVHISN